MAGLSVKRLSLRLGRLLSVSGEADDWLQVSVRAPGGAAVVSVA